MYVLDQVVLVVFRPRLTVSIVVWLRDGYMTTVPMLMVYTAINKKKFRYISRICREPPPFGQIYTKFGKGVTSRT